MKKPLIFLFLITITCCYSTSTVSSNGHYDMVIKDPIFKEILDGFPIAALNSLVESHLANDPEFQAAIRYMQGKEFVKIIQNIREYKPWIAFKDELKTIGFNVDTLFRCIIKYVKEAEVKDPKDAKPSLEGFLVDAKDNIGIPLAQYAINFGKKMQGNEKMQAIYDKLKSEEVKKEALKLRDANEFKQLWEAMEKLGLHVQEVMNLVYGSLQWNIETETLAPR